MTENAQPPNESGDVKKPSLPTTDHGAPVVYFDEAPTW